MIGEALMRSLVRRARVWAWRRRHPNHLAVFNYHQVSPIFLPAVHSPLTWTPLAQFEVELEYLSGQFTILGLAEALDRLRHESLPGPCAAITFDDGDDSVAEHCAALLEERGVPATFFINSACWEGNGHYWFTSLTYLRDGPGPERGQDDLTELNRKNHLLRTTTDAAQYAAVREEVDRLAVDAGVPRRRCVSPEWLAQLNPDLFALGAHGHEHQRYAMMSEDWQRQDLCRNVEWLRQFKAFRPLFAIPFGHKGDYNEATLRVASECRLAVWGAEGGVNVSPGPVGLRIPADSRSLRAVLMHEILGR
jgi:peptidoglycan/xylan/chitin deacetylase (PgdA/CDA1 family)